MADEGGRAHLDLSALDRYTNMHQHYRVAAWFEPGAQDPGVAPARSEVYMAYTQSMSVQELNS